MSSLSTRMDRAYMQPFEDLSNYITELADRIAALENKLNLSQTSSCMSGDGRRTIGPGEAARMLGLSKSRVYVLCGQGRLPVNKVGNRLLFFPDDLVTFIRSGGRVTSQMNQKSNNKKAEAL